MNSDDNIKNSSSPSADEGDDVKRKFLRLELERRLSLASACMRNDRLRALEIEMCRLDPVHFANNWLWTFDPREQPANLPFQLWACQEELLRWIEERYQSREGGLIEKSRDMGASWVFVAWFLHSWIFKDGFFGRLGSRKEELVDDSTEESLFGKLRYALHRLPRFLMPKGYTPKKHATFLLLRNPDNDNKLVGESANQDFGRGGRSSATLLDESASIPKSESVLASISQNSNCVFHLSSPKGKNNAFYRLKHKTTIPVKTLHWSQDPRKDEAWYEKQKELLLPWEVGQELDLSYDVETGEKIYHRFSRQWHVAKEVIECNPDFEQFVTWDFGLSVMAIIFGQVAPDGIVEIWQAFEFSGYDIDFFIPIRKGTLPKEMALLTKEEQKLVRDCVKKIPQFRMRNQKDYGDHAGTHKTANSKRSCKRALEDAGFDLISTGKQTYDWRIKCLDRLFRLRSVDVDRNKWKTKLLISPDCVKLIDCLNNYVNSPTAINRGEVVPLINWASHLVTALEFFAINRFPIESKTPGVKEGTMR